MIEERGISKLVVLIDISRGIRLDQRTWAQEPGYPNAYFCSHSNIVGGIEREGEPASVHEDGAELTKKNSIGEVNSTAGSWFYDSFSRRLWIHCSDNAAPSAHIIISSVWARFANWPYVFDDKFYLPLLEENSIGQIDFSTGFYNEGGTRQAFGNIGLINADGFFNYEFPNYIWHARQLVGRVGKYGDNEENFLVFMNQWTGDIEWSDEIVSLRVEDLRRAVI